MVRTVRTLMLAAAVLTAAATGASAQTTTLQEVMFHWGSVHLTPGQAVVVNFELTDHFGDPLTLPVGAQIEDKSGNIVFKTDLNVASGSAVSIVLAVGSDIRTAHSTIQGDIYGIVGPEVRTIQPCIKVIFPPGPGTIDRMTATLEVMDVATGRLVTLANNPHMIIGVLAQ